MNGTYLYLPKLCCSPWFIIKLDPQWWFSIEFWHPACIPYKVVDKLWVLQHTLNPLPDWTYPHIKRVVFVFVFFCNGLLFKLKQDVIGLQKGNITVSPNAHLVAGPKQLWAFSTSHQSLRVWDTQATRLAAHVITHSSYVTSSSARSSPWSQHGFIFSTYAVIHL